LRWINKWWACHLHYSITSLNIYIYICIYIYAHRREQCREKKNAPRSNRALFDLRDKDKKKTAEDITRTLFEQDIHTMIDMSIKHSIYTWMMTRTKQMEPTFFLVCLYNKHHYASILLLLPYSQLFLICYCYKNMNDAFCL
jgi:hypothetical protein